LFRADNSNRARDNKKKKFAHAKRVQSTAVAARAIREIHASTVLADS